MLDITKTMKFYDPIYQVISIKPRARDLIGGRSYWRPAMAKGPEDYLIENILVRLIDCPEVWRLNYLRQSGLAFLVYPSSTHTRFAHSLGTYYLGQEALSRCWVESFEEKKLLSLEKWVEELELKDEFLIALFLHDVGHFPFSHLLENNYELPFKLQSHEDVATDYIMGKDYSSAFVRFLKKQYNLEEVKSLSKALEDIQQNMNVEINKKVICYLISGDEKYLDNARLIEGIKILENFTSNLLDLDRFDHYTRDSFFMGTNLARFNVRSFLDDVIVTSKGIRLKGDGASHALSLLQSKENINTYNFEDAELLAYEAMLNYCISRYFSELKTQSKRRYQIETNQLSFWTDEELIHKLGGTILPDIKSIMYKLRFRKPYSLLGKFMCTKEGVSTTREVLALRDKIIKDEKIKPYQLLFRIPRKYGEAPDLKKEWLSIEGLMDEGYNKLYKTEGPIKREALHFREIQESHKNKIWVFTEGLNNTQREKIKQIINKSTGGL